MLTQLLLGLAITVILFTAQPIEYLRYKFLSLPYFQNKRNPPRGQSLITLLTCPQCFMFWFAIPLYFCIPYIPNFLEYAIYLCASITAIQHLKYKLIP